MSKLDVFFFYFRAQFFIAFLTIATVQKTRHKEPYRNFFFLLKEAGSGSSEMNSDPQPYFNADPGLSFQAYADPVGQTEVLTFMKDLLDIFLRICLSTFLPRGSGS